jgi:hypothetical protein
VGTGELLHAVSSRIAQIVMNTSFRMLPANDAAKGDKSGKSGKSGQSPGTVTMQQMMRSMHFRRRLTSRPSPRRRRRGLDALAYGA